jgi:hypothetical protein
MKKISILLVCSLAFVAVHAQLNWPAVTTTTKPWTRWWWEGSAVNKMDLSVNLQTYQQAGLGGVEITPIYGIHGAENQFIDFLSPKWMDMLQHTLNESKRLGMGVDMANATGWPFGGPWVTDADASKSIYYKTYTVAGCSTLSQPIEFIQEPLVRTANNKQAKIETILNPVALNKNLQDLALDQIQFAGKLPLQTLVAYGDQQQVVDLTRMVDATGKLNWTAPAGNWTLYALFEGLHGKMVERAAPGGEGYALDHFSLKAANNYFKKFDQSFKGYDLSYMRGFFNDSYEVDDARGQGNWTDDFLEQFKKAKGYDLRTQLPALFGKADAATNSRVIYDYRSVIDALILKNFTQTWKGWAGAQGKMVRNQSHGSPANTLDLYSVVDIPETEGTDILRFKFATSAANVTGKQLVSSESATWLNEHFLSSWGDVKKAIDLYFLGGVNHIFYHGLAYSPQSAPWPGWLFYAAVHFQPTNPQWKDFHTLNTYITRTQSFLQKGRPDNDILLYYPIVDRYAEPTAELLQHFDGMEKNFEHTNFEHASQWMMDHGYSFDFFSDRQLQAFQYKNDKIVTGNNNYATILYPASKLIDETSFQKIIDLAKAGATVLFYKNMPMDVPGFANLKARQKLFRDLNQQFIFTEKDGLKKADIGKGAFIIGEDLDALLTAGHARKAHLAEKGLSFIRRKNTDGIFFFISNRNETVFNDWIELNEPFSTVGVFDPMTGATGISKMRKNAKGLTEVLVQLQPYESIILQTYAIQKQGNAFAYNNITNDAQAITGSWNISFKTGGPTIPANITTDQLVSWTELGGEDVKNFSGTATYKVTFKKPIGNANTWLLNLGKVHETAEVFLNGKPLATLIGPIFQCVIPNNLLLANNTLEITVANLMANRIAYMDRNKMPWKIFYNTNMPARKRENSKNGIFDASDWKPVASGLLGPVTIGAIK